MPSEQRLLERWSIILCKCSQWHHVVCSLMILGYTSPIAVSIAAFLLNIVMYTSLFFLLECLWFIWISILHSPSLENVSLWVTCYQWHISKSSNKPLRVRGGLCSSLGEGNRFPFLHKQFLIWKEIQDLSFRVILHRDIGNDWRVSARCFLRV